MTITYSLDVANTRFCGFAKLLGRWKGSIYKILWKEFFFFIAGYALISATYRCFLDDRQKRAFESVVIYFESFVDLIPLSFVLGFYVSLVVGRWWQQYDAIPWPDRMCYLIATYVHGSDERSRVIRRTLGRYLIQMQALTFQSVSTAVKRRFPTTQHFVLAGFMTQEEHTVFSGLEAPYGKWWLPAQWFSALAMRARKEGRIKDTILLDGLMKEFLSYRSACGTMFNYDWISVPLVYTQVVTLATYTYSLALMVGRQYLDPEQGHDNHKVDLYVPIFTLLQFFFYMGWLKVAEQIVNPYGEDDDDFELNWCLNRSCQVVYMVVDQFHTKHPKLRRDAFWDISLPELPQTKSTAKNIINPQLGSAFNLEVNPADAEFLPPEALLEEDNEANVYSSDSVKGSGSGIRYRPSFLASLFGQSLRKRSLRDPVVLDKSSPANSRKSSVAKRTSPSHSRASSISFNLTGRQGRRSYDPDVANGTVPECAPPDFEGDRDDCSGEHQQPEHVHAKLDCHMPPIPEEPASRVASSIDVGRRPSSKSSEVQSLVAEASKVLEELNKAVASGEAKGYESCCSLDSDDSSSAEDEAAHKDLYPDTVTVDLPHDDSGKNISG